MQQPNENKLILVPEESLLFGALFLHIAIERLAFYWGLSPDECYERLSVPAWTGMQKLSPQGKEEIIEAWTKTVRERKSDFN